MWKKYFKLANNNAGARSPLTNRGGRNTGEEAVGISGYPNLIPESYTGMPNRIDRYSNFESMDQDSEVNSALDILSEFSTQADDQDKMCFTVNFKEPPTETESKLIKKQLQSWYYLNQFQKRSFRLFRNVLKYGDQVFIRDPETFKLFYVEMDNVIKVIVNESDGKKPEQYVIRNINPNFENLTVTQVTANNLYNVVPSGPGFNGSQSGYNIPNSPNSSNSRFTHGQNERCIAAEHILHLSLTEGLDPNWPFGTSILEMIFKVFKQKELLEDSILIYRIQRAPERRVFKIDVGDMPSHQAMQFIEKVKNEIHQRRIPGRGEGGMNSMDSTYEGLPPNADFFFPVTAGGRGSSVEILPGGCLEMSTGVPLLDGRTLSLSELTNEFNDGKENWVYSCDPLTGHVVPGIISWAGVTQESAKVMKITLDNGETITSTLDHKFPIIGRNFIEAKDLIVGDRLIPFNKQNKEISKNIKNQYTQIYQNDLKKWEYVHRFINETISLNDFVYNNKFIGEKKDRKIGETKKARRNNPDIIRSIEVVHEIQRIKFDKKMMNYVQSLLVSNSKLRANDVVLIINNNENMLNYYLSINKNTHCTNWNNDCITPTQLKNGVKKFGYLNWRQFKNEFKFYNHSIVKIEFLGTPIQVGTLTIDQDEKYHNFHTFALESGVFTKNSNLAEINDLLYFNNKMMRGLRIPSSYLPTGPEESTATLNDGRVGTALIQEFRFNQYCQRLQQLICGPLDTEFKAYLKFCGINIDSSIFQLTFNPPQNFAHYRQAELDASKIGTFTQLEAYPYFSKRWLMQRYLGLDPDEMLENQKLWREENVSADQFEGEPSDLRNLGITPGGIDSDMENFGGEDMDMGENPEGEMPLEGGTPQGANTPVMGNGAAPPTE
jgi:hypothetical protein